MDLIIETDIGRDPDDFFALCYFISAGVNIRAITISPGDEFQIRITRFLLKECGLDIPIGVGKLNRTITESGSVHKYFIEKYNFKSKISHDGLGPDVIKETLKQYPNCDLFVCGPLTSVGRFLKDNGSCGIKYATMQGGFLDYESSEKFYHGLYEIKKLDKFIGKKTVSTFNLNGDVKGAFAFFETDIYRTFAGKNVCHTVVYDKHVHEKIMNVPPKDRAAELLREGMAARIKDHPEGKMFHDPVAAFCCVHPSDSGLYIGGHPYRVNGTWGTDVFNEILDHGYKAIRPARVLTRLDENRFWDCIAKGI